MPTLAGRGLARLGLANSPQPAATKGVTHKGHQTG